MRHRALDYPSETPVTALGLGALDELLDRGDLADWEPLASEIRRDPWGAVAENVAELVRHRPRDGTASLWQGFLDEMRRRRPPSPAIGAALRELRERQGLSQAEVAHRLEATQPEVSKLEARRDARLTTIRAYVRALDGELRMVACIDGTDHELG